MVTVDLTSIQRSKLATLDSKTKRGNVLLRAIVVTEVDVETMEVVALGVDSRSVSVATRSTLCIDAAAELDSDLILGVVIGRIRVSAEDGMTRLCNDKLLLVNTGVDEDGSIRLARGRRCVESTLNSVVGNNTINRRLRNDKGVSWRGRAIENRGAVDIDGSWRNDNGR